MKLKAIKRIKIETYIYFLYTEKTISYKYIDF